MARSNKYPDELTQRGIRLALESGRPIAHVAACLGIHPETLRKRVRQTGTIAACGRICRRRRSARRSASCAERFAVTAYKPAQPNQPDIIFVSRRGADGTLRPAGVVQLGLAGDQRAALRAALEQRARTSSRRIAHVSDGISVLVGFHGPEHGPLRDPLIRAFSLSEG